MVVIVDMAALWSPDPVVAACCNREQTGLRGPVSKRNGNNPDETIYTGTIVDQSPDGKSKNEGLDIALPIDLGKFRIERKDGR